MRPDPLWLREQAQCGGCYWVHSSVEEPDPGDWWLPCASDGLGLFLWR